MAPKKQATNKTQAPDRAAGRRLPRLPGLVPLVPVFGPEHQAMGRPMWADGTEWPVHSRRKKGHDIGNTATRKEQRDFEKNRYRLFSNSDFRKDILVYKQSYPPVYWKQRPSLTPHAQSFAAELLMAWVSLCEKYEKATGAPALTAAISPVVFWADVDAYQLSQKWGLDDHAFRWIQWLANNWDPTHEDIPRSEPRVPLRPNFNPCRIFTEDAPFPDSRGARKIILELKPGVTRESARQALEEVLDRFEEEADPAWVKAMKNTVRPGLTDRERRGLAEIFSAIPLPTGQHGQQTKAVCQAIEQAHDSKLSIAPSTIKREYRRWLSSQGQPPKKYKKFSDSRPSETASPTPRVIPPQNI